MKSIFPDSMLSTSTGESLSLEGIASKLTFFHEQIHLIHWQTSSYAEHMCTGELYDGVHDFKDSVIEKLMGYTGRKPRAPKMIQINDNVAATSVVNDLKNFAQELKTFAETNNYLDIGNMADELSGKAAKALYLLTLS